MPRLRPSVVLLDAGGVIVLPHRGLVAAALAGAGTNVNPDAVAPAHYRAVRELDRGLPADSEPGYLPALCRALRVSSDRSPTALAALRRLADRRASGKILWSEAAPGAKATLRALHDARVPVVVVTNSDGHGERNLRDAQICQAGPGPGVPVAAVVDSTRVGHIKPDPAIFAIALASVGVAPAGAVHVGDMLSTDIAGATAAGVAAIHLDPVRRCRDPGHRHVRALPGVWKHLATHTSS